MKRNTITIQNTGTHTLRNMSMQYTEIFKVVKNENFQFNVFDIFLIFAQNIDCGYKFEPPRQGGSNKVPTIYVLEQK